MLQIILIIAAALSLAVCLAAPVFFILGSLGTAGYRNILLAASIIWFLCAALLAARRNSG